MHGGTHEETEDETDDEFGFYTTRVVRADNEHEATERALNSIRLELDGSFPRETLAQLTLWVTRLHRCRQGDAERIPTTGFTFYGERLRP